MARKKGDTLGLTFGPPIPYQCPKCRSKRISTPKYIQGLDRLRYRCEECGHEIIGLCWDHKP